MAAHEVSQDEASGDTNLSDVEGPVLSQSPECSEGETEGPEARLREIWNEDGVPLERQEEVLTDLAVKASPAYFDEFFGNYFKPHAQAPLALGKLYRDWLSISVHEESPDPTEERLAQYQVWAEELVVGGEREDGGAAFRRFCRLRLAGLDTGMDVQAAGEAYHNGQDDLAPKGCESLSEREKPEPETLVITPEDQAEFGRWQLHLLTGIVGKRHSSFHQALDAISRPGALQLALERIQGDASRREWFEARLIRMQSV